VSVAPSRPVLRYHGGKWMLAPWLLEFFPAHRTYVEPFGGAASVLLRKPRAYSEVYNDLDGEVVNVFRVLRDPARGTALCRALELTPFARAEFVESYAPAADAVEQARRTIVRSFMGFGSASASGYVTGFRANSSRSGTTPAHDWRHYPAQVAAFVERLRGVVIENRAAVDVVRQHDSPETLFYVDPPYVAETRDVGGDYRHEMTDGDHAALAEVLRGAAGMVVLSGYPCDLYDRALYADWARHERRHLADGARERTEVVWCNPACAAALERQRHQLGLDLAA
jgi:DNA adenine methylase